MHDKTAYGKGLADFTKANFEAAGGKSDLYESINAGEQDYSALVTKLKARGVEALYFGGYHAELGLIARQSADQNYKPVFLSGDAQNTLELWSITGDSGEGILFTFAPDPRSNSSASSLVERFRAEGYEPEGYTLYTYAAIQVWAEAARTPRARLTRVQSLKRCAAETLTQPSDLCPLTPKATAPPPTTPGTNGQKATTPKSV